MTSTTSDTESLDLIEWRHLFDDQKEDAIRLARSLNEYLSWGTVRDVISEHFRVKISKALLRRKVLS